jgi:TonB family protein
MHSASHLVLSPRESTRPSVSASALESAVQQYDAILAHVEPSDVARDEAAISDSRTAIVPLQADLPRPARVKRSVLYASVGVAAVAIAGPLMLRPRAGGGTAPASAETGAAVVVGAARADSFHFVSAPIRTTAPPAQPAQPAQRAPEASPPDLHLPRVNVHLRPLSIPNITVPSISAGPSVDSTAGSAAEQPRASDTAHKGAGERASPTTPADVENAIVPARIIGPVPQPRFPDALLRPSREGKVVVRFMVNELGRVDVASMIVEQSDHELFTAAVRDILPRLRFEPARTRAPESKPVASWVSVPFRFTTKKD